MRRARRGALPCVLLALLVGASSAQAQEVPWNPYGLTVYREGPGFRLGNAPLTIHPGLSIEAGYDTNVFYLPVNPVAAPLLRLRAHVDLTPLRRIDGDLSTAAPKLDFRLSTQLEYREYLMGPQAVRAQRGLTFFLGGFLTLFPQGRFSLRLDEDLVRSQDPRNAEGVNNFARVSNRTGLTLTGRLGGGRLEIGVADFFQVNFFDSDQIAFGNNYQNDARIFAHWRMLPNVLFSVVARVGYIRYLDNPQLESVPIRARAEASVQFTSWIGASLALGYGNSLGLRTTRLSTAISQEEVRFTLPKAITITVGHERDFRDSIFAAYYTSDRIYLGYQQPFLQRLRFHAEAAIHFRHYEGLVDPALVGAVAYSDTVRDDQIYEARAGLSVQAMRWLVVGANYNFIADRTDFRFIRADGSSLAVDYVKHSVFGQVDFAY